MSNLVDHAERELRLAKLFDEDGDYGGQVGRDVLDLVRLLASQGHSGGSHQLAMAAFVRVANFKTLTALTDNPDDWMEITAGELWQSRRQSSCFSIDGGKTHYDIDKPKVNGVLVMHDSEPAVQP